jgi:ADP-ribose pyrophosphatase YjhB (NUDIX family)
MAGDALPVRMSSRVVLLDNADRVLLIEHVADHPRDAAFGTVWVPPGGGLEAGESLSDAALRELWEETGLKLPALGPLLWTRRSIFNFTGTPMIFAEHFFLGRVDAHDFTGHINPDQFERENIRGIRWWPAAEIQTSPLLFAPRRLGALLEPVLKGIYPASPIALDDGLGEV